LYAAAGLRPSPTLPPITLHPDPDTPAGARFTIVIPTWNNLGCLRLCVESIRKHSAFPHQLVVHVSDGSDGTLAWVRGEGLGHSSSRENAGVCLALNAAASLGRTDFVLYMNDDMYACPGWDAALLRAAEELGERPFLLSATAIEPKGTSATAILPHDFGEAPEQFREAELLAALPGLTRPDWSGASVPPVLVRRSLWDQVGGYSLEYWPGHSSDQDFAMKLWRVGVRIFRGVGESRVYHFRQRTTSRVASDDGRRLFALKWGLPLSWFSERVLRMGTPFAGPLPEMETLPDLAWARWKAFFRRLQRA
jgi:glycosyltransferase involved in cell wall biosynthesis